ncbi:biotin-dependent carboxyltransferase family protein [Pseudoalteromonas sp. SWN166]|uniref:5-oxoprolinase subunit C family protein n=1 Tax=Pseudoalteromonas sp. SWN166 TaxID=2792061 RepID=UPI0018CD7E59|nr:biotin-dependent carboxyltransferase family protein [Pseudoalteromonas sp. SWN166]MBH0039666.1 biotin-dependent carboxyltransferase family protein [Pseudoalteromonas sp. SWN166]
MIKVLKSGVLLTIQDFGRNGYRHLGVSKAGSLDPFAQIIANRLLNNNDNDAVLEITVGLCELEFTCDTVIALHGADLQATLDGQAIYPGWTYAVKNKQVLSFGTGRAGLRAYFAVKGGIQNTEVMGSKSTDLNARFGGIEGRALTTGDEIPITPYYGKFIKVGAIAPPQRKIIRLYPSPHANLLGKPLLDTFAATAFKVSTNSNRMGVRLEHNKNSLVHSHSLPSLGVSPGSIQLPPNGDPIVLLNDGQTTGGYPLLGTVIEADLHQFAQFRPLDTVEFKYVTFEEATKAKLKLDGHLHQLSLALKNNL